TNNTPGTISTVTDILPPGGVMNVGAVVSDRVVNQLIGILLSKNQLPNALPSPLGTFFVQYVNVAFLDRNPAALPTRPATIAVDGQASARIRVNKGGFFGTLFGLTRKVTVTAGASVTVDAGIAPGTPASGAVIDFGFTAQLRARVTIQSVLI